MSSESATGVILRTRPLTETSLIVHWLTAPHGRIATVAKGARRPKSPFRGKLDVFYLGEFSFARSRRSELHTLREVTLRDSHPHLRGDMHLLQQAAYCAALIEQTTEMDTPLPGYFELMCSLLAELSRSGALPRSVLAFEVKLLGLLGLKPDTAETRLTAGSRLLLEHFACDDWRALAPVRLSTAQVAELRQFLHGFLVYHLGKIPAGRSAALLAHG